MHERVCDKNINYEKCIINFYTLNPEIVLLTNSCILCDIMWILLYMYILGADSDELVHTRGDLPSDSPPTPPGHDSAGQHGRQASESSECTVTY